MQVRCPQCKTAVDVDDSTSLGSLSCQSCGSIFDLLSDATVSRDDRTDMTFSPTAVPKRIGHFELGDLVGSGGYGSVWKALDTRLERTVAIKIPRNDLLTRGDSEQFFREARAAAQLQHPNIVSVHEVGREEGISYIVSDFIEGSPLSKWRKSNRISPNLAAALCAKIADALGHAHQSGIVHRDVKPSNVMIDENGDPHVMDFGLAKRAGGEQQTMAIDGHAFGTPAYMSPEQARGEATIADQRSDLYSLGVILFQLLTSELPFRGSARVIIHQVLHDDPPHAQSLSRSVPQDLDTICWKLMEKLPQRRYATAGDVADELRRFLKGEPIHARPISQAERYWRWYRRNRLVSSLAIGFVAALLLGIIGVTSQWIRAERNATDAENAAHVARFAAESEKRSRADAEHFLYIARMNTAQQAFELRDLDRVQSILDSYAGPFDPDSDPRGFEWFYWANQSRQWQKNFDGHTLPVLAVDVSREGRWIVSSCHGGTIRIWDATEANAPRVIRAHERSIYAVALSPDGKTIASGGRDSHLRLWDFASGELRKEWKAHEGSVFCLRFSADGKRLVTGGSDTLVKLWDIESTELVSQMKGHEDFVYSVDLSRDGELIASCGLDRSVRLWNAKTGKPDAILGKHMLEVWDVAFSEDSSLLATASADKSIRLWDVPARTLKEELLGHNDRVRAVAFTQDNQQLVSVGHDRTVRTWDLTIESKPLSVPFRNLNRTPNHFFERMNLPEGKQSSVHVGHTGPVTCLALAGDGNTIVSGGEDLSVVSWQLSRFTQPNEFKQHSGSVNCVDFSKDGAILATASNDRTVRLWDPTTGSVRGEPMMHQERVFSVSVSPDGRRIATGTYDGVVTIWNTDDGTKVELTGHQGGVSQVSFSPDGHTLASAGHDATVRLWDVDHQQETLVLRGHEGRVLNVAFFDQGNKLASTGHDHLVRLWDTKSGERLKSLDGHTDTVWAMAAHQHLLATGGEDRSIRIWDLSSGETIRVLRGHADLVQSLAFSPDGKTIASGSGDKTIRLWDVKTGESKTTLKGHGYRVWSVAFDPSGSTLVSSSYNLRFWRGKPRHQPKVK